MPQPESYPLGNATRRVLLVVTRTGVMLSKKDPPWIFLRQFQVGRR